MYPLEQQLRHAVVAVLMSKEVRKTEKDLNITKDLNNAEDLITVLKPLKTITTVLCMQEVVFPVRKGSLD